MSLGLFRRRISRKGAESAEVSQRGLGLNGNFGKLGRLKLAPQVGVRVSLGLFRRRISRQGAGSAEFSQRGLGLNSNFGKLGGLELAPQVGVRVSLGSFGWARRISRKGAEISEVSRRGLGLNGNFGKLGRFKAAGMLKLAPHAGVSKSLGSFGSGTVKWLFGPLPWLMMPSMSSSA